IIPYQNGLFTIAQAISTYNGPDQGKPIINSGQNNIFLRAKNLQPTGTESGTVALNYAKASLLLVPAQWVAVLTGTGKSSVPFVNQAGNTQANPNDILLGQLAFLLTGLPPASNDHYCFIAIVTTPNHQVSVPASFPSNAAFASWVQNNPAVGWRNISVLPNTLVQQVMSYVFGNMNQSSGYYYFQLKAASGNNYPTNTGLQVQCTDLRCQFNWTGTLPAPDGQGNQITGFQQFIPGNITTTLTATMTSPNGQPFPANSRLSLTYYQVPSSTPDELELSVIREYLIVRPGEKEATATSLILLGECSIYVENLG
ncbi:MAG: hypothetical protein WAO00_09215, partial [Chthoniobacterales bacterium]